MFVPVSDLSVLSASKIPQKVINKTSVRKVWSGPRNKYKLEIWAKPNVSPPGALSPIGGN